MRRAPIVALVTAAGLAGVLAYHTSPASVNLGFAPGSPARSQPRGGLIKRLFPEDPSGQRVHPGRTRTAIGPSVNYEYGVLSVRVTVTGHRIVKVAIASLNDGGLFQSQFIDQQAIPILESEALRAQSANIQGVSGASYTSGGFAQSLQGALHALGLP